MASVEAVKVGAPAELAWVSHLHYLFNLPTTSVGCRFEQIRNQNNLKWSTRTVFAVIPAKQEGRAWVEGNTGGNSPGPREKGFPNGEALFLLGAFP